MADSENDWHAAFTNDGIINQGEFGWEYGYISNYAGVGNIYFGWHQNAFYWEQASDIMIYWPKDYALPSVAWGEGGDSTGCRPPMHWSNGAYSWAEGLNNRWAATRRWVSDYTGAIDITGTIGHFFDPLVISGWDVQFVIAINGRTLQSPTIYSRYIAWNDAGLYDFFIPAVPVKEGDSIDFMIIPVSANASNSYMRMTAVIRDTAEIPTCDLDGNGIVNMKDFLIIASQWQSADCGSNNWCQQTDMNYDGKVDLNDLSKMMAEWLIQSFPKADFDKNYTVDLADYSIFASQWNAQDCDMNTWCQGCDMNRDRVVDLADLNELLANWLTAVSVPTQDAN